MLMRIKNIKIFWFNKLMFSKIFDSQRNGERSFGSTAETVLNELLIEDISHVMKVK